MAGHSLPPPGSFTNSGAAETRWISQSSGGSAGQICYAFSIGETQKGRNIVNGRRGRLDQRTRGRLARGDRPPFDLDRCREREIRALQLMSDWSSREAMIKIVTPKCWPRYALISSFGAPLLPVSKMTDRNQPDSVVRRDTERGVLLHDMGKVPLFAIMDVNQRPPGERAGAFADRLPSFRLGASVLGLPGTPDCSGPLDRAVEHGCPAARAAGARHKLAILDGWRQKHSSNVGGLEEQRLQVR